MSRGSLTDDSQKMYFSANCISRGSAAPETVLLKPAEPKLAALIWPKVFTLKTVVGFGSRVLLVRLKASARSSTRLTSPALTVLASAAFSVHHHGPAILAPPIFPSLPVAGRAN